jgi:hypothetical protein
MKALNWQKPETTPVVPKGDELEFWVAIESTRVNPHNQVSSTRTYTFLAQYQNRPLETDEDGEYLDDDYLTDVNGEPVESIGWVSCKAHDDFDNFYEKLDFNENYKLLAWAEYTAPEFNGFN